MNSRRLMSSMGIPFLLAPVRALSAGGNGARAARLRQADGAAEGERRRRIRPGRSLFFAQGPAAGERAERPGDGGGGSNEGGERRPCAPAQRRDDGKRNERRVEHGD